MTAVDYVLERWEEARDWQPSVALVTAAEAQGAAGYRHGWPGFPAGAIVISGAPHPSGAPILAAAYRDYDALNEQHFVPRCPPVVICFNRRLRSTGAQIDTRRRVMELNGYRIQELPETRTDLVFHEMIHLWLYAQGLPAGHTPLFKAKMAERGHTSIRYGREGDPKGMLHSYPGSDRRVVYRCPGCQREYLRRRLYSRPMLCGGCLKAGHGRQKLVLTAIQDGHEPR